MSKLNEVILEARGIKKDYRIGPQVLHVLRGIDLTIKRGEMVGIFGPSGSGKSTLLHILGSLEPPTEGEVIFQGTRYTDLDDKALSKLRNEKIGFVFQFHHLFPEFTALENTMIPCIIKGLPKKEARERAMRLLELVGLCDRIHHRPDELSGGERQRVAVARALANDPEILLADEPTGNLDKENTTKLLELLCDLNQSLKTTILIVSHNERIKNYTSINYNLENGRLFKIA